MKGRMFGIKKSLLLKITAIFLFLCFAVATFFAFYSLKIPDLWFYNFCISLGLFQIVKGFFFKLDSVLYIGFLLLFIGLAGYLFGLQKLTITPHFSSHWHSFWHLFSPSFSPNKTFISYLLIR